MTTSTIEEKNSAHSARKKPSLKINALSNLASLAVETAIGFFLTPVIIHYLGKTGFGIFTLIGSFIGYYGLLDLGVGTAVVRYLARYAGEGNHRSMNEVASTAMIMFCCTGVLAIVLSFLLAQPLAIFFKVQPEHFDEFKYMIWIIGITIGLGFPGNLFRAIVTSHEYFVAINTVNIASAITRTTLVVVFLKIGYGLTGLAWAVFIAALFTYIANIVLSIYYVPHLRVRRRYAKATVLKTLVGYGGATTIIVVGDLMRSNLDSFVIGRWVNLDGVGVYGVAAVFILIMKRMIIAGMSVLGPRFANLDGAGDRKELKNLFTASLSISALLAFGSSMLTIIIGRGFIILWVGDKFLEAYTVLWVLTIALPFALSQNPSIGMMYALRKHHFYAAATIVEALANVTISIVLAKKYGIVGVALGTMISSLVIKIFVMPFYVAKILEIRILDYAKPIFTPAAIALIMIGIAYSLGIMTIAHPDITGLICTAIAALLIYLLSCLLVGYKLYKPFMNMMMFRGRFAVGAKK